MSRITIAADQRHFERDGAPFVLVADTAWSAFADAQIDEWRSYARYRVSQGFNSALVSILPILHDRAVRPGAREPFAVDSSGHYDYSAPDEAYFTTARQMTRVAHEEGLTLGLVVLWLNYVPGTWGAERTPWSPMTEDERNAYLDLAMDAFADLDPLFIVSGDEHFRDEEPIAVYADALRRVKERAPWCLTTLHSTPDCELPPQLADSEHLDFYSYQAGHNVERQQLTWELAEHYRGRSVPRPVVDLEPCYEGHGYGGGAGRYLRHEVRRATWWSLVGGASAGIGYGAHGVWQWFRPGAKFTSVGFSLVPFPWQTALRFPGADDVAFAAALTQEHRLYEAAAHQELLIDPFYGLRLAANSDFSTVAVYLPDSREVRVSLDLSNHHVRAWALESRTTIGVRCHAGPDVTLIEQPDTCGDVLVVFTRRAD